MTRVLFAAAMLAALFCFGCREEEHKVAAPPPNPWLQRSSWSVASIPVDAGIDSLRGRLRWYNPNMRDATPVHEVYPDREYNTQQPNTLETLVLEFQPDSSFSTADPERSWGGVMRYLKPEERYFSSMPRYLEFALKLPSATAGPNARLIIDLGEISEDALPNDSLDTEDSPAPGQQPPDQWHSAGNGVLAPEEDTGLDKKFGTDPNDSAYWNGLTRPPVPSWDDWAYSAGSSDFSHINGTEHNRNDAGHDRPDTEDLDGNQTLDTLNNYFSYTIPLDGTGPYLVGGANRWRYYSIPLQTQGRIVGSANIFSVPLYARFYLTGIRDASGFTHVEMVDITFKSDR